MSMLGLVIMGPSALKHEVDHAVSEAGLRLEVLRQTGNLAKEKRVRDSCPVCWGLGLGLGVETGNRLLRIGWQNKVELTTKLQCTF
jgi:hypothetical protein